MILFLNTNQLIKHVLRNWIIASGLSALAIIVGSFIVIIAGANRTNVLVGLFLGVVVPRLLSWGFKDQIMLINRLRKFFRLKHVRTLGFPDSTEDGIMYYKSRPKLPLKTSCQSLTLTFGIITIQKITEIKTVLSGDKKVKITFLLLDPNSEYVNIHSQIYTGAENLKSQITNSLSVLSNLQKDFPEQVFIKTFHDLAPHSIIILDEDVIKVEDRLVGGDADSRPSHVTFADDNKAVF
jgi:hypothetical protein